MANSLRHARYVGPIRLLRCRKNNTALIRPTDSPLFVEAQFDGDEDWRLPDAYKLRHPDTGARLCVGWHLFPAKDFSQIGSA